jgi:indolepyruvate ferredoxin oxidoreductase alpha subunit
MRLLSGNEAIARGAWESGVQVAAGYPGTPSTEILEALAPMPDVYAEWSPNEKVALDVAIGAAYAGVRAMAVMKHVGLNVAADSLFYASMTGMEAGLVIVSADDPGMHSSQNEQDNRRYAKFARIPCLEPTDSQEAKDLVGVALSISEEFDTPVMLRITTRIAHSYTPVELGERKIEERPEPPSYRIDTRKYVMVPGNARRRHPVIEERIAKLAQFAESFPYNQVEMDDGSLGIITNGVAYQYAKEVFPDASILKLGMTYPLPKEMIRDFASRVDRLIVLEELDPFIEEEIRLMGIEVEGKSIFPICGEFNPQVVRESAIQAGLLDESARVDSVKPEKGPLPPRPPILCPGCPHRGVFHVTKKLKLVVNGDIGCYTLGFLPPQEALHTCGCMGASIGVAHGVAKAMNVKRAKGGMRERNVAVIGDSTFFHTGMPALLNVAYNQSNTITIILDNRTTAMTGHQDHPGTGRTLQEKETVAMQFEDLARAMGIEEVHTVDPYDLQGVEEALRTCLAKDAPAVIVARRECALLPEARRQWMPLKVNEDRCNGCGLCFQVGCPALVKSQELDEKTGRPKASIEPLLCTGCEICAQVCARKAILFQAQLAGDSG